MKAKKSAPKLKPSQRVKWLTLLQKHAANQATGLSVNNNYYRVVLDTNILVSAILYGGKPEKLLRHVLAHQELILSDYIVEEFVSYLKLAHLKVPQKFIRQARQKLEEHCRDYDIPISEDIRDINDTDILRLAIAQNAFIVSGDRDILEYKTHSKVVLLNINEYLALFTD